MKRSQFLTSLLALAVIPIIPGLSVSEIVETKSEFIAFFPSAIAEGPLSNESISGVLPVKNVTKIAYGYMAEIHHKCEIKLPLIGQVCVNKNENVFYLAGIDNLETGICKLKLLALDSRNINW